MIHELPAYGVFAYHLDLQIDVMEPLVSEALQQGVLTVPQGAMR